MRLPDKDFSVKIGPFRWEVMYSDGVAEESNSFGTINIERQRIYLKQNGTQQKREETFIHEMLHAISYVTGLWKDLDTDPRPNEEQVITRQAMVLYQVIQDNPYIFKEAKRMVGVTVPAAGHGQDIAMWSPDVGELASLHSLAKAVGSIADAMYLLDNIAQGLLELRQKPAAGGWVVALNDIRITVEVTSPAV